MNHRPVLLAHQGTGTEAPENTMEAFRWAIDHGAQWIETDVWVTADGHLVCLHDGTLDRTTSGHGPVGAVSLADAEALGVPALAAAMDAFRDVEWNIDLKEHTPRMVATMTRFLDEPAEAGRVRIASFHGRTIRAFRRATAGAVRTAAAQDEVAAFWLASRGGRALRRRRYDALQVPVRAPLPRTRRRVTLVDRRLVTSAHRVGIEVHVWTIDDPEEAGRLAELGVDGIITNRIDLVGRALG